MPTFVNVYRSLINNCAILETTQMSFNWWMTKQIVGYSYNGKLISNKKEEIINTCSMGISQKHYTFLKESRYQKLISYNPITMMELYGLYIMGKGKI